MKAQVSQLLASMRLCVPQSPTLWAPADIFFTRSYEVPEGVERAELADHLEMFLEAEAPFPVESLASGFLYDSASRRALIYATPFNRLLKLLGDYELSDFYQAFPGFVSFHGQTVAEPTLRFVCQNGSLSALWYVPEHAVPVQIRSRRLREDVLTDAAILEEREAWLAALPTEGYVVEPGVWMGNGCETLADGHIKCLFRHLGTETESSLDHRLALDRQALWDADIRDAEYILVERRRRRRARQGWMGLQAAGALAVILLVLQVANWGLAVWTQTRLDRIQAESPRVARIEEREALADRLTQQTQQEMRPFAMLEILNRVRPPEVHFTRADSDEFDAIQIDGEAGNAQVVNQYSDALRALPVVAAVDQDRLRTIGGRTTFTLTVRFNEIPVNPSDLQPSRPEEASGASLRARDSLSPRDQNRVALSRPLTML